MSVTQGHGGSGAGQNALLWIMVGAALLGGLWLINRSSERALERSATGNADLVKWLRANDVEARLFKEGAYLIRGSVGLRILPLYDVDLALPRSLPETTEEVINEESERDLADWVFQSKVRTLPTLVILPKWRAGMRKMALAHRDLLISEDAVERLLDQILPGGGQVERDPRGFSRRSFEIAAPEGSHSGAIGLVHAQTISAKACEPVLGDEDEFILGWCALRGADKAKEARQRSDDPAPRREGFWLLADPDLLNNHGIVHGDNSMIGLHAVRKMLADRSDAANADTPAAGRSPGTVGSAMPVILDMSDDVLTVDPDDLSIGRERTWEDFARLFRWPFSIIWLAFAAVGGLVLWRAWVRGGPVERSPADHPRAAKTVSIDAKARLLRLAGHDGALLSLHAAQRLRTLYAELAGPHRPVPADPLGALFPIIARRSPELAEALQTASLESASPATDHVLDRLDRFEKAYDRICHEFGRTSRPG